FFTSAEVSAAGLTLNVELAVGQQLEIPIAGAFVFSLSTEKHEVFEAGQVRTFPLVQHGVSEIAIERPEGWGVQVGEASVEVTAPTVAGEGEIVLYAASSTSLLKLAAFTVAVEGGSTPVVPPVTGNVELDKLYGYGENTTGGEGASAANIHHFDDGKKFNEWLYLREKNKSTTPAIVWLSGTFTKDDGRATTSPWFDIKRTSNISIYGTDDFVMENVGFFLNEAKNIIIRNIHIKMPKADNGADGISMQESENVWVDHCTFESMNQTHDYEDGSCDVTHATRAVTVSWSRFIKTQKTCLVGHSNSATADKDITVTFHHNYFDNSSSRHPRVRFGRAHVYNNFYDGCTTYGAGSAYGAMVLVEHNCFDGVALPTDICTYPAKPSGSSWVSNLQGSVAGYLYECYNEYVNNPSNFRGPFTNVEYTAYNGSKIATPYTYEDFKPAYTYVVDEASRIAEIVPAGAGAGKLPGFDKAPIAVDNGGITTTTPGTDPDPVVPEPVELANGWMTFDYNSASSAVATVDGGVSITACGKFESGAQTFGYVYREITGDFVMTAVVESYESTKTSGNQSLAGIMLTPDVTASATAFLHSMAAEGPASAYCYSHRVASGNASRGNLSAPAASSGAKAVLRLDRWVNDVLLSYSLDGGATFGATRKSSFAELPATVCVGLASNSGDSKATATAVFGDVRVDGETLPVPE
ncbi:MAG: polysaccharide lyase family 1 protein, partial [Alistipes sp.]|nr:polysaccharide lyase family 1 protein [Alistipes sp.]